MDVRTIGEGVTDVEVIRSILISYTEDKDLFVSALWPNEKLKPAGWTQVFNYCKTDEFRGAFQYAAYVVVQIDADIFRKGDIPGKYVIPNIHQLEVPALIDAINGLLIREIGDEFFQQYQQRIIFAIAVDQIECWLLPAYFPNQATKAKKTTGCIATLNEALTATKAGFTIDKKDARYYQKMCRKRFGKKQDLQKFAAMNPSLEIFLKELATKLPQETEMT